MMKSIFYGSAMIAVGVLLATGAGCDSSIGTGATGTGGSSSGSAGSGGSGTGGDGAGTGGSNAGTSGSAGTGGGSAAPPEPAARAVGRGGNSAGTTGAAGRGGGSGGSAAGRGGSTAGTTGTAGAAGSGTGGAPMPSTGCGTTPTTTAETTYMIDVAGTSRSYIVTLPANYNASQPHPLVFTWHGRTGTAMQIARGNHYNLKSRMTNAIFVAGQGLGTASDPADTGWPNTNGQDIAFVRALLTWMNTNYCVDQARVFSTGFSYGGIMSHTIGCQMSDLFRAIAPIAGARFGGGSCLTRPIAAWMTHGMLDTSSSGGVDFSAGESARNRVVTLNHCAATTMAVPPTSSMCVAYDGCDGGYPVHWCPHAAAHTIPSFAAEGIANFFLQF